MSMYDVRRFHWSVLDFTLNNGKVAVGALYKVAAPALIAHKHKRLA